MSWEHNLSAVGSVIESVGSDVASAGDKESGYK